MKKEISVKSQLESGTYFKIAGKKQMLYNIDISDSGMITLCSYHVLSKGKLFSSVVSIRRLGDNNMDYFTFDMFGKKTRGRIQYSDITEFVVEKKKVEIEKCPIPGIDAVGVTILDSAKDVKSEKATAEGIRIARENNLKSIAIDVPQPTKGNPPKGISMSTGR